MSKRKLQPYKFEKLPVTPQLSPRLCTTFVHYKSSFYIYGGFSELTKQNKTLFFDMFQYDLNTSEWTKIYTKDGPELYEYCATLFNNKIILYGGQQRVDSQRMNDVWSFDLEKKKWDKIECKGEYIPQPRNSHACVVADDQIFIFGGYSVNTFLNVSNFSIHLTPKELISLDKEYKWTIWRPKGTLPPPRTHCSLTKYKRKLIVFSGKSPVSKQVGYNDVWEYDLDGNFWEEMYCSGEKPLADMHNAIIYDDTMYVFANKTGFELVTCFALDLRDKRWRIVNTFGDVPTKRYKMDMLRIEDQLFLFGGGLGKWRYNDFYVFQLPSSKSFSVKLIEKLWIDNLGCDVTIKCENGDISAHKFIIAQSNALKQMLDEEKVDFDKNMLQHVFQYLYVRILDADTLSSDQILQIAVAAKKLDIAGLEIECYEQCAKKLTTQNFPTILRFSFEQKSEFLTSKCVEFYHKNKTSILADKNFEQYLKQLPKELQNLIHVSTPPIITQANENVPTISEHLHMLYKTKNHADVILISKDGKRFPAHKPLLMAASEYFQQMFSTSFQESKQQEIIIDTEYDVIESMLKFIYFGEIQLSDDSDFIIRVCQFAEMIMMDELEEFIANQRLNIFSKEQFLTNFKKCVAFGLNGKLRQRFSKMLEYSDTVKVIENCVEMQVAQEMVIQELEKNQKDMQKKMDELEKKLEKLLQTR